MSKRKHRRFQYSRGDSNAQQRSNMSGPSLYVTSIPNDPGFAELPSNFVMPTISVALDRIGKRDGATIYLIP